MTQIPPGSSSPQPRRFDPRAPQPTMHPRKVRGGIRLESREGVPLAWAGQRWMRLVEDHAPHGAVTEGTLYARMGQTRSLAVMPGHISARVQGRMPSAYPVDIRLPVFTHDQWEAATTAMLEEARHIAGLLSGEVPAGIEDLFAPLHLRLFPQEPSDLAISCTCGRRHASSMLAMPTGQSAAVPQAGAEAAAIAESVVGDQPMTRAQAGLSPAFPSSSAPAASSAPAGPWCKHVCCVMAIMAERLSRDPFLIFQLRGLNKDDLLERLRQKRALVAAKGKNGGGSSERPVPAYSPRIPGIGDEPAPALELCLGEFWQTGPQLAELDMALEPPAVSHVLLRRLGPSPFAEGKFPLVGLLATCYEEISTQALRESVEAPAEPPSVDGEPAEGS